MVFQFKPFIWLLNLRYFSGCNDSRGILKSHNSGRINSPQKTEWKMLKNNKKSIFQVRLYSCITIRNKHKKNRPLVLLLLISSETDFVVKNKTMSPLTKTMFRKQKTVILLGVFWWIIRDKLFHIDWLHLPGDQKWNPSGHLLKDSRWSYTTWQWALLSPRPPLVFFVRITVLEIWRLFFLFL